MVNKKHPGRRRALSVGICLLFVFATPIMTSVTASPVTGGQADVRAQETVSCSCGQCMTEKYAKIQFSNPVKCSEDICGYAVNPDDSSIKTPMYCYQNLATPPTRVKTTVTTEVASEVTTIPEPTTKMTAPNTTVPILTGDSQTPVTSPTTVVTTKPTIVPTTTVTTGKATTSTVVSKSTTKTETTKETTKETTVPTTMETPTTGPTTHPSSVETPTTSPTSAASIATTIPISSATTCSVCTGGTKVTAINMWRIQQLASGTSTIADGEDVDGDGKITDTDVKAHLATILRKRMEAAVSNYCADHPFPPTNANITSAEWNAICAWNESESEAKLAAAIRTLNLTAIVEQSEAKNTNDLNSIASEYEAKIVQPDAPFLLQMSKFNGIGGINYSFSGSPSSAMEIERVLDLSYLPKNIVSITSPPEVVGQAIDVYMQNYADSVRQALTFGAWVAPTQTPVAVQNNFLEALNKYKAEVGIPTDVKADTISENSYVLIEGYNFGQMSNTGLSTSGSSAPTCTVRLKWMADEFSKQETGVDLLPATGDWTTSWTNNGIYAYVPSLSMYRGAQPTLEVTRTGPDGTARHLLYGVARTGEMIMNSIVPSQGTWSMTPKEFAKMEVVAGDEMLVTGYNLGTSPGKIELVLNEPIEAYALGKPYGKLDPTSVLSDGKTVPLKIVQWSDRSIRFSVDPIAANFGGQEGILYITRTGSNARLPYRVFLSPDWSCVTTSGYDYFEPNGEGLQCMRVNGVTFVSHDPECGVRGNDGNDYFFRSTSGDRAVPPNTHYSRVYFEKISPDIDEGNYVLDKIMQLYGMASGNLVDWASFLTGRIASWIDSDYGSYETEPNINAIRDPSLIETLPGFRVHWENTCSEIYEGKKNQYIASFKLIVPEGVQIGE